MRADSRKNEAAEVVLKSFAISGDDYSVDPVMTTCMQGQTLQLNQTCNIIVDFMPLMAAKQQSDKGALTVTSNAEEVHPKNGVVTLKGSVEPSR